MADQVAPAAEAKKWEIDYQSVDENGGPIGKKTHLGPFDTPEELIEAQRKQNEEAVRAYFRVKNATLDPATPRSNFEPKQWDATTALQTATEAQQPSTFRKAVVKTIEDEFGAPIDEIRTSVKLARSIDVRFEIESFKSLHPEYYVCPQNQAAIEQFMTEKQCDITVHNLEVAMETLDMQGKLEHTPSRNVISEPAIDAEVPPANPGGANPPTPRRTATGIEPGSFSGTRRQAKRPGLTKQDYKNMPRDEYKRHMANPKLRAEMDRVLASE